MARAAAISTSSAARTLCRVAERIRVAKDAPDQDEQAAGEQVHHHRPVRGQIGERHGQ